MPCLKWEIRNTKLEIAMASKELIDRTFNFAVAVGKLTNELPANLINRSYCAQIIRSSSSVYANFRASQRAKSDRDFLNKLKIVEEECDETIGFLELLLAFNDDYEENINSLINEGNQLLRIVVASINTVKTKMARAKEKK
jgi:four helix bundle protein